MVARTESGGHFGSGPARPDWHSVSQRLGHRDDVGGQTLDLKGEPPPGSTQPGLHLVQHQQGVPVGTDLSHTGQIVRRRYDYTGLALNRLDQNSRPSTRGESAVECVEIVVG